MVEPVSSLLLNSLLAARFSAVRSAATHISPAMLYLNTTHTSPSNFFTPNPRRIKRKPRPAPQDPSTHPLFDCSRPWPRDSLRDVSFDQWSLAHEPSNSLLSAANSAQSHSYRRSVGSRFIASNRRYSTPRHLALKFVDTDQRRHASSKPAEKKSVALPIVEELKRVISCFQDGNAAQKRAFNPEKGWDLFYAVQQRKALLAIRCDALMSLLVRLALESKRYYGRSNGSENLALWGNRIQSFIDSMQARVWRTSPHDFSLQSLRVRSLAMLGRIDEAVDQLDQLSLGHNLDVDDSFIIEALVIESHEEVLSAMHHYHGASYAFNWLMTRWSAVGSYLAPHSRYIRVDHRLMVSLRRSALNVVAELDGPVVYLSDRHHECPQGQRQLIAEYLVHALCQLGLPGDALPVIDEMQQQSLVVSFTLQLVLIVAFVRDQSFELANTLYSSLAKTFGTVPPPSLYVSTGLFLFSHQGDVERARECFDDLKRRNGLEPKHIGLMLHAMAVNGQTTATVQLFEHYFPRGLPTSKLPFGNPSVIHLSEVVYAYAQRNDDDGINTWLDKMSDYGCAPDEVVYSKILKSFASRGDVEFIARLLDQMRSLGFRPTRVDYTTIISLMAKREDPVGAEAMYNRALKEGIVPDRLMINALMHAHVEAGSWQGVIRAFDYMMASKDRRLRPSIAVLNTLLKAYVLIGAPFRVVSKVFSRLDNVGVRPTARTFALLIQSACDAGHMDIALDLFREMEKLAERWQSSLHISVYVLTLIMNGYLGQGNKQRAKEIYDEMDNRGIAPSAVTLSIIVNAYAKDKTEESWKLAREFIQSHVNQDLSERSWDRPSASRRSTMETIYHPLLDAYAKGHRLEDVEKLYQEMLEAGSEPTLGTLTVLLDAYRRSGNAEAALEVWPQIFQLGLRYSQSSLLTREEFAEDSRKPSPRPSTILCIPLSICIDALSMGGYHTEVAAAWRKCKMNNFAFDSHNWNHLVVALVRAGEPERAFEVLERVILPYQRDADLMHASREKGPDTPLIFDAGAAVPTGDDSLPKPVSEAPMHKTDRRRGFVGRTTKRIEKRLLREPSDDFAHPLHILHQIAPSWGVWKPHAVSLGVLAKVFEHLSSGRLVQPLKLREESNAPRVLEDDSMIHARMELAAEILGTICTNFPNAVRAVEEYEFRHRRKRVEQLEFEQRQDIVWT